MAVLSATLAVAAAICSVVEFVHVFDGGRAREAIEMHWPLAFLFAAACVLLAGLSRFAYVLSIPKIHSWGDWVMASFDCYLADLAARLGYQLPKAAGSLQILGRHCAARRLPPGHGRSGRAASRQG